MKKLLAIIVLGLLWSGNVYSDIEPANPNIVHEVIVKPSLDVKVSGESKTSGQWKYKVIHKTYSQAKNMALETCKDKIIKHFNRPDIAESCVIYSFAANIKGNKYEEPTIIFDQEVAKLKNLQKQQKVITNQKKQDAIMFTIKDKREQCEAIGFKPKTEKFADCVLRLVELDIKKQQDNKIAAAQNSGNMQIANQLLQMRNDNNAQYLIDLGQQLLTPQSFNSNIYLPQTQNCTIMGFDSFAKMTCN